MDITVAYHLDLTGKFVNVTNTKVLDTSHGHVLSAQERQTRDDNVMARMCGKAKLQIRIGALEGIGVVMKKEGAKMCKKMAKAKTTSGWRNGWRGAPLVLEMSPKAKNVAGSKQTRKREASESLSGREPVQKFGKRVVERYGWEWFECQREAKYMGDEFVNEIGGVSLYADEGMPINVGAILRQNMKKFRNNLRWKFCYGGLITHFLRAEGIDEETVDITVAYHLDLTGALEGIGVGMKKEGAKMCMKMAKAKTTSGWRIGWRGAPPVLLQSPSSGALRGATRPSFADFAKF
uniref:Uncharacterized protein n=1 Tax=Solanum tuberosum TaxID=4113 RepID=M1DW33_SOLTU